VVDGHAGGDRREQGSEVPCGDAPRAARSSQFVHIGPTRRTRSPTSTRGCCSGAAPAAGHVVMGYDERGRCPMLIDEVCSIYEHRPRTCRTYDCRVFPAAGIEPDDKPLIAIARDVGSSCTRTTMPGRLHDAVRAAGQMVRDGSRRCRRLRGRTPREWRWRSRTEPPAALSYTTSRSAKIACASATSAVGGPLWFTGSTT
jgi:Fe-S-cluster containining protein